MLTFILRCRSTTDAQEADSSFSSFWESAGATLSIHTENAVPTYTTTNIANPVVSDSHYFTVIRAP